MDPRPSGYDDNGPIEGNQARGVHQPEWRETKFPSGSSVVIKEWVLIYFTAMSVCPGMRRR